MDAFEEVIAEVFFQQGYWTENSVKVNLTKEEKVAIGRPSSPRWEIDVVAYSGAKNELIAIECKSFLDSRGVTFAEFLEGSASTRYKLFREEGTRKVVLDRLRKDLSQSGYIPSDCAISFALVAGKIATGNEPQLKSHFDRKGWLLFGPEWVREKVGAMAASGYSNSVSAVVSKILLR